MDYRAIWNEAETAAKAAAAAKDAENKTPERERGLDCGFAWVDVPDERSPFVTWARQNNVGHKHHKKGWTFWCTGYHPTQSISTHQAAAQALARVLRERLSIEAHVGSRLD